MGEYDQKTMGYQRQTPMLAVRSDAAPREFSRASRRPIHCVRATESAP